LLLIDDCSGDKSLEICKRYAQQDNRVKVYHKKVNEGTAQARKTGICYAAAEYVIFADNDDWVEAEMLEELYRKAVSGNYDMVCCDFYHGEEYCRQNNISRGNYELMKQVIAWGDFYPITWNKLVRREIYKMVTFPQTTYSEDRAIMAQVLYNCKTIGYLDKAFYHWCIVKKSASRNRKNRIKNLIEDYISYKTIIIFANESMKNTNEIMEAIVNHADQLRHLCSNNNRIIALYKESIKKVIGMVNSNNTYSTEIEIEQRNFENEIKKLDKYNYKKYIVELIYGIKSMIPKGLKRKIKKMLRHG